MFNFLRRRKLVETSLVWISSLGSIENSSRSRFGVDRRGSLPPTKMKSLLILALCLGLTPYAIHAQSGRPPAPGSLCLFYDTPGRDWGMNGLPIGNGQMGAMIFGNENTAHIQFNEESLWQGNEDDTGKYQNFGEITFQFDGEEGVTCPSGHVGSPNQSVENTVDGKLETKWCFEHHGRFPIIWQQALPATRQTAPVTSYTIASAEDVPDRDPSAWRLEGSQDGVTWTLLDERKDEPVWKDRNSSRSFTFENKTIYAFYRLVFLAVHNQAPHFQVSEISLGMHLKDAPRSGGFRRSLDLAHALQRTSWTRQGAEIVQEAFASHPNRVIVIRWSADRPGAISGTLRLTDAHGAKAVLAGDTITISGEFPGYTYPQERPLSNRDHAVLAALALPHHP